MPTVTPQQIGEMYNQIPDELKAQLWDWFQYLDTDHSGELSVQELYNGKDLIGLGEDIKSMDDVARLLSAVDANQNGQMDFFEFCYVMVGLLGDDDE